jgi:hypothetical protein
MTWNHAFTVGFAVPRSQYEDDQECVKHETSLVIAALLERVALLAHPTKYPDELAEALGKAFDSYDDSKEYEE